MSILNEHFYHNSIRTYTALFGTIFNNLKIKRSDGKEIKVPIAFAEQQKYNVRQDQDPDPDNLRYMKRTPRMSFTLVSWNRDPSRVKSPMQRMANVTQADKDDPSTKTVSSQYNRVPYTFGYQLNVTTKYLEDMLQIFEQIVVYFNPTLQVVVKDNPDLNEDSSVAITLEGSQLDDQFEGTYEESRVITATFDFTLEGYLYLPTNDASIIRTVTINYFDLDNPDTLLDQTVVTGDSL